MYVGYLHIAGKYSTLLYGSSHMSAYIECSCSDSLRDGISVVYVVYFCT